MNKYFLDTYAIIEIIKGNPGYQKFGKSEYFTSIFHTYELYYQILRDYNKDLAKRYYKKFEGSLLEINDEDIFLASKIRLKHRKKRLSYADSLGYAMSIKKKIKFLTGDKEFEDLKNVEFVK